MSNHTTGRIARVYVACVVACGVAVVLHSLVRLWLSSVPHQWFVLAGLTLLSGSFTVRIPTIPARLSVSETFVFAAVLLYGPAAATIIVVLDTLVISLWLKGKARRAERVLFNMAAPAVAIWIAAQLFYALAKIEPLSRAPQHILSLLLPLFALALCYFLLNSALVAVAVAFERRMSAFLVWRQNFAWLSLNFFSGASVAALLLPFLQSPDSQFVRIVGVILPLLVISYLTFKTTLGRVEDANSHLRELNRLYLSTIETLAMAIDAKDQITHGHIRRVQTYAVELASALGLTEDVQLQAVQAAALLHDMGKLAIPEYILNKPGPLTPSEFEKMKLHASVGADILSAIEFPYPVVPMVRHHHESWDGSGYPDGLSGSDIPLGARILSVVDCFDALTSDRPYRPKLTDEAAIEILRNRRGKMYDPLVVDTFIRIHPSLTSASDSAPEPVGSFQTAIGPLTVDYAPRRARLDEIVASRAETMVLLELARDLGSVTDAAAAADVTLAHITQYVPGSTAAVFVRTPEADTLDVVRASGPNASLLLGLSIPMGQRLTGWVGANRQTMRNADAVLDLGDAARLVPNPPRVALSTAIIFNGEVIGALTVFLSVEEGFNDDHERVLEAIASHVASPLHAVLHLKSRGPGGLLSGSPHDGPSALIYVQATLVDRSANPTAEENYDTLSHAIRRSIRPSDEILTPSGTEFVIQMTTASREAVASAAGRVSASIDRWRSGSGARHRARVRTTFAISPDHGSTVDELLEAARSRATVTKNPPVVSSNRKSIQ